MIEIRNLTKTYRGAAGAFTAIRGINLTIGDGDIFGIIGLSGAGKSTLVRCINLLETPTGGRSDLRRTVDDHIVPARASCRAAEKWA